MNLAERDGSRSMVEQLGCQECQSVRLIIVMEGTNKGKSGKAVATLLLLLRSDSTSGIVSKYRSSMVVSISIGWPMTGS